jgi:hypothetical protein
MKLKASILAGLIALSLGAQASSFDLSLDDFETQANFTKPVTFTGAQAIKYDFDYSGATNILLSLTLGENKLGTVKDIDFTSIKIVDATNTVVSSWTPAPLAIFAVDSLPITSTFSLILEGKVLKTGSFDLSVTAMPVPEPQSYALLLAGLGVVSFTASRRRQR